MDDVTKESRCIEKNDNSNDIGEEKTCDKNDDEEIGGGGGGGGELISLG